jgi:hypothetical protein
VVEKQRLERKIGTMRGSTIGNTSEYRYPMLTKLREIHKSLACSELNSFATRLKLAVERPLSSRLSDSKVDTKGIIYPRG